MKTFKGKSAYAGIVLGNIVVIDKEDYLIKRKKIDNPKQELERIKRAKEEALEQLKNLYDKAVLEVGEANATIFEVHQMMLEDDDFNEAIQNIVFTENVNAEYAVSKVGDDFSNIFASMDDDYMKNRAIDVKDIAQRIVRNLYGRKDNSINYDEAVIVVADDLRPSETVQMDKNKILAFVTVNGSTNSHTSILARMMNIPAIVSTKLKLSEIQSGMEAVVDGFTGEFIVQPSKEIKNKVVDRIQQEKEKQELLLTLKGKPNITKSGKKINLYANIGSVNDVGYVLRNDAGGIGLFRSEFLYIGRDRLPSEEEQFTVYKQTVQMMAGKKVIIRTLDIGADKEADYLKLDKEENPALGYRAIRICLCQPDIFKSQLRAIFRASVYGNIAIMYPMITSVEEVIQIKEIVKQVKLELTEQCIPFKDVEEGIMIETPASAIISDELAELVDFFSLGTNDLTQYTLAVDRQNQKLEPFYKPHHKAILRLIKLVTDNAHKAGKWVGICGELGADTELIKTFVDIGIDELSVAPANILKLRKIIRQID